MIRKVLVANRGEIAVRIIRACREMEIETVAVYSEADRDALHAKLADEAVCIGPARPTDSYLAMEQILSAAVVTGADAIHPGFGFLSENSRFAELCEKCGIIFIGPPAEVIARMGNKQEARNTMQKAGIPIIPGSRDAVYEEEDGLEQAKAIGYPVMIKAALGGGGKGMRVAQSPEEFRKNFRIAQTEAISDGTKACGGTDSGRLCRKYDLSGRTGLFYAATASEGAGGSTLCKHFPKSASKNGGMCCGRGKGSWICERRYDRVFTGAGWKFLFYGNEYQNSGRASGYGMGYGCGPDQGADSNCGWTAAFTAAARCVCKWSFHRSQNKRSKSGRRICTMPGNGYGAAFAGRKGCPC